MKRFNKLLTVFVLFFIVLFCSACIHKNSTTSKKTVLKSKDFYFTQIADVPLDHNNIYYIEFYNWSNHSISLDKEDFIVGSVNLKTGFQANDLVDVSDCKNLSSHSSCHILLKTFNKLNDSEGSFSLSINKGNIQAVTIIKYFTSHKDLDFDVQFGAATTTFNFNKPQPISLNIPIVFNKDFYDIKITHDQQINYQFLNCDVSHFIKNTVCILQINGQGGKEFNSMIKVIGKYSAGATASTIILETPIVNAMSNFGNLLLGLSANSVIANGTNTVTLSLANNGLGSISGLTASIVNSGSPLSITSNSCTGGSIASNGSCSIVITAANSTVWNVDGIKIQYNDGFNSTSVTSPIVVVPNSGAYGALNLAISGNMVTTKVNTSSQVTITVSNNGSLAVNNIIVSKLKLPTTITQYQNTCSSSLAAGVSCKYVFQYSPTVVTSANSFLFVINGNYTYAGSPVTISNQQNIQYSATNGGGYLSFDQSTLLYNVDLGKSAVATVFVKNVGAAAISGLAVDFSNTLYPSEYSVVANSVDYAGYQDCSTNGNLAVGATCVLSIQFNPQGVYFDADNFELNYTANGVVNADFISYQSNTINSAVNIVVTKSVSGNASGSGTIGSPYLVNTLNGNDFSITYTYNNQGSASATNFSVSPTLSAYYSINNTGLTYSACPIGTTGTLAAGGYCQIKLQGLNPNLYNVAQLAGAYNLHTPGVSFRDSSNGIMILNNYGDNYINFVALYTAQIINLTTFDTVADTILSKMTATISQANRSASTTFSVFSPSASGGNVIFTNDGTSATLNNCVLTSTVGASCYVTATYSTLGTDDDALFQATSGSLVSWIAVPNISALAYFYTQDGTNLKAWKLNTDYSFKQLGSAIASASYPAVTYNNQLLLFRSSSQITAYPIKTDGSLGTATTVTVSPAFSAAPSAATVSYFNGNLYVGVVSNPGASAQIITYKCGSISAGSTSCTSQTASGTYNTTNIYSFTAGNSTTSANTLYYLLNTVTATPILYSTNDGATLNTTGGSLFNPLAISTSNYMLNSSIFFVGGALYSAGYSSNGSVSTSYSTINSAAFSGASSSFFILEAAMNYVLPVPAALSKRNSTDFSLYFTTFDNSITSVALAGNNVTVYVPLIP